MHTHDDRWAAVGIGLGLGLSLMFWGWVALVCAQTPQPGTYSGPDGKFIVCTQSGSIMVCR